MSLRYRAASDTGDRKRTADHLPASRPFTFHRRPRTPFARRQRASRGIPPRIKSLRDPDEHRRVGTLRPVSCPEVRWLGSWERYSAPCRPRRSIRGARSDSPESRRPDRGPPRPCNGQAHRYPPTSTASAWSPTWSPSRCFCSRRWPAWSRSLGSSAARRRRALRFVGLAVGGAEPRSAHP